jgi:hypothetical protein
MEDSLIYPHVLIAIYFLQVKKHYGIDWGCVHLSADDQKTSSEDQATGLDTYKCDSLQAVYFTILFKSLMKLWLQMLQPACCRLYNPAILKY